MARKPQATKATSSKADDGCSSENTEDAITSSDDTSVRSIQTDYGNRWHLSDSIPRISQYRGYGTECLVNSESLLASGVESLSSASLTARAAQIVIQRITRVPHREGKEIEKALRFTALENFKEQWISGTTFDSTDTLDYHSSKNLMASLSAEPTLAVIITTFAML